MSYLARVLARRLPTPVVVVGLLLHSLAVAGWLCFRLPALGWSLVAATAGWVAVELYGWPAVAGALTGALVAAVAVFGGWSWLGPGSFEERVATPLRSWRRARHYRARWADAVHGCGLVRADVEPTLMAVRSGSTGVDRLAVHMAPGQLVTDWRDVAPRLASALEVRSVRVRHDGPRDVLLLARWREPRRDDAVWPGDLDAEVAEVAGQLAAERELGARTAVEAAPEPTEPTELPRPAFPRRPR